MSITDIPSQSIADMSMFTGTQSKGPVHNLGKDEFLQMLITQLRHQDPMNPVDDQSFIADLAQFSSLEQMSNMNETLKENLDWNFVLSQTINNTMATSIIGHQVKAAGNEMYLPNDGSTNLNYNLSGYAENATIDIFDGSGKKVATYTLENVGKGDQVFEWDGKLSGGAQAQAGTYSFSINATNANGDAITATPYILGTAEGVQYSNGQAYLVIDGAIIPLGDVIEVGPLVAQQGSDGEIEVGDSDDDDGSDDGGLISTPVEPEDVNRG